DLPVPRGGEILCPRCAPPPRIPTELNGPGRHSAERGANEIKTIKGNRQSCLMLLIALNKFESCIARFQPPEFQTVCFSSCTLCPSCAPGPSRNAYRIQGDRRRQVRVAHRRLDAGVAEQPLDGGERHSSHHQMRCECVPERVPADRPEPSRFGRGVDHLSAGVRLHVGAVFVAKDEGPTQMPMLLERRSCVVVEGNLPASSSLGRAKVPAVNGTTDDDPTRLQANVRPLE